MNIVGYVVKSDNKFIAVDMNSGGYIYETDLCYNAKIYLPNDRGEAYKLATYWNKQPSYCKCDLVVKPLYMED